MDIFASEKLLVFDLLKNYQFSCIGDKIFAMKLLQAVCADDDSDYISFIEKLKNDDKYFAAYCIMHERISLGLEADWNSRKGKKYLHRISAIKYLADLESCMEYFLQVYKDYYIDVWKATKEIDAFLDYAHDEWKEEFLTILSSLFQKLPHIEIKPLNAIRKALGIAPAGEVFNIINNSKLDSKDTWLMALFLQLKESDITNDIYESCMTTIERRYLVGKRKGSVWGNEQINSLLSFEKYKKGFVCEVFKKYLAVAKKHIETLKQEELSWTRKKHLPCIYWGFIEYFYSTRVFQDIGLEEKEAFFGDEVESIFYELYFYIISYGDASCSDEFICHISNKNIDNLYRYFDIWFDFSNDYIDKKIINKFPNVAINLLEIIKRRIKGDKGYYRLFCVNLRDDILDIVSDDDLAEFMALFFDEYKSDDEVLHLVIGEVGNFNLERQAICYKAAIENSVSVEIFSKADAFLPNSWSGSFIPSIHRGIKVIEQLSSYLLSDGRKYINYLKFLDKKKDELQKSIERHKIFEMEETLLLY